MNVFIINAHAEPKSFNGAMFRAAHETMSVAGHSVQVSDLYAMKFDPVSDRRNFTTVKGAEYFKQQIEEMHATEVVGFAPDVEAEMRKAEWCDLMIWQFPLWWFGLPAILKGWVDRVFAMGRTYGGDRFYENGVFKGKRAMLSVTTGGPAEEYQAGGFNGDIHAVLRPIHRGMLPAKAARYSASCFSRRFAATACFASLAEASASHSCFAWSRASWAPSIESENRVWAIPKQERV
jgi:NAD(P)H dehydrogenase (quinone)